LDRELGDLGDEARFLGLFRRFCEEKLPRNPRLRADMISRIQTTAAKSAAMMPFRWYRPDILLPPLPDPWQQKASEALRGRRIANITIRNVAESSLQLLQPDCMINDEIVEGYLELVRKAGATVGTTRLLETEPTKGPIDRAIDIDILKHSGSVLFPIHDRTMSHWTFARIALSKDGHTIIAQHFNSLEVVPTPTKLKKWLRNTFQDLDATVISGQTPQQKNGADCGLYMLMGIRMMAAGSQHLTQADADEIMPTFRQRVLAEILAGDLDPDVSTYANFVAADKAAEQEVQPPTPPIVYNGTGELDEPIRLDTPKSSPTIDQEPLLPSESAPSISDGAKTPPPSLKSVTQKPRKRASLVSLIPPPVVEKPSNRRGSIPQKKTADTLVKHLIDSFAKEKPMILVLKSALITRRLTTTAVSDAETLAALWSGVTGEGNSNHILTTRHDRARFSRAFYWELKNLGWSEGRVDTRIRLRMEAKLNCLGNRGAWKSALAQASRSSIWVQLADLTSPLLALPSQVAICAVSKSTTVVENLNEAEREKFLEGIERRLHDQRDTVLGTLGAASALYNAITNGPLPHHPITMERIDDLELLDFTAIVSLAKPPARLPLPYQI
jgi:hypothetical protein